MTALVGKLGGGAAREVQRIALLGITGMRARDMVGYCILLLFAPVPFFAILLMFLPY